MANPRRLCDSAGHSSGFALDQRVCSTCSKILSADRPLVTSPDKCTCAAPGTARDTTASRSSHMHEAHVNPPLLNPSWSGAAYLAGSNGLPSYNVETDPYAPGCRLPASDNSSQGPSPGIVQEDRRRATFNAIHAQLNYPMARYLTSLGPIERENNRSPSENRSQTNLGLDFGLEKSCQSSQSGKDNSMVGLHGRHNRSPISRNHYANDDTPKWMNWGIDLIRGLGSWVKEESNAFCQRDIDEDSINGERFNPNISISRDLRKHGKRPVESNLFLNVPNSPPEHMDEPTSNISVEEACSVALKVSNDPAKKTNEVRKPIPDGKRNDILRLLHKYFLEHSRSLLTVPELPTSVTPQSKPVLALSSVNTPVWVNTAFALNSGLPQKEPQKRGLSGSLKARKALMRSLGACVDNCRLRKVQCKLHHHDLWSLLPDPHVAKDKALVQWAMTVDRDPEMDSLARVRRGKSNLAPAPLPRSREKRPSALGISGEEKITLRVTSDLRLSKAQEEKGVQQGVRKLARQNHEQLRETSETFSHSSAGYKGLQEASSRKARKNQESCRSGTRKPALTTLAGTGHAVSAGAIVAPLIPTGTDTIMNENPTVEYLLAGAEAAYIPGYYECPGYTIEENTRDEGILCNECESSVEASDDVSESTSKESVVNGDRFLTPFLDASRRTIVDNLMQEVWVIFDKTWTANYTTFAGNAASSCSPSGEGASNSDGKSVKRHRPEDDNGNSSGGDNGRAPKRTPPNHRPQGGDEQRLELSCPFRKHDPRKYCCPNYRTCARNSWDSVGRVKEHIYRWHRRPIQCTRCGTSFGNQELLVSHEREETKAQRCEVKPKEALDGITPETELLLKSRKKDYKGQSEPELWKKMYRILFPDEIVPSPYFEAILDESADQSDLQDRADYDAYCRRELPRLVRSRLESAVASQLRALESALRTQLDDIIENCLEKLSARYQASRTTTTAPNSNENARPASTPMRSLMNLHDWPEYFIEADNTPEPQNGPNYFTNLSQYRDQPPTPSGSAMHGLYCQPNEIMTGLMPCSGMENSKLDSNATTMCYCPEDACTCPIQRRHGQEQMPTKILRGDPMLGIGNADDFPMGAGLGSDGINLDWDDGPYSRARR